MPFFDVFVLDMQRLVNDEIASALAKLEPEPLCDESIVLLQEFEAGSPRASKCLYVLHYDGEPVYVGKAESKPSARLIDHYQKLGSRVGIDLSRVGFRCLYLDKNWSALAHEKHLIDSLGCSWNKGGFGNHDPGRRRDTTILKDSHFDRRYPVDPGVTVPMTSGIRRVDDVLEELRENLPYQLRFESSKSAMETYQAVTIKVSKHETAEALLGKIVDSLGADWQVTILFGYVILYRENTNYSRKSFFRMKRGGAAWVSSGPS